MKIPKKMNLLGEEWIIKRHKLVDNSSSAYTSPGMKVISIAIDTTFNDAYIIRIFFHELSHVIGYVIGEHSDMNKGDTSNAEKYACLSGLFWSQVFQQLLMANAIKKQKKKEVNK